MKRNSGTSTHPLSAMKRFAKRKSKSSATNAKDSEEPRLDINSILKDIEFLGSSHMTWKDKKNLENKKIASLGGKPPTKQRLPLCVARVSMKNQKGREEKLLQEHAILGTFGGYSSSNAKKPEQGRRLEGRILRSTVGIFRNGILDVKHMLHPSSSLATNDSTAHAVNKRKKNKSIRAHGKRKGSGKGMGGGKRHS